MRREMNVREAARERDRAREWWDSLSRESRFQLGDDLVLGEFDWRDWGFESRPSRAFMNEIDYQRILWESIDSDQPLCETYRDFH